MERQKNVFINNYLIPELKKKVFYYQNAQDNFADRKLINNEFKRIKAAGDIPSLNTKNLNINYLLANKDSFNTVLNEYSKYYKVKLDSLNNEKEAIINQLTGKIGGKPELLELKQKNQNKQISENLENAYELNGIISHESNFYRNDKPIYVLPTHKLGRAHFYAPNKLVSNTYIDTLWFNIFIIWLNIIFFGIILYYDLVKRIIKYFEIQNLKKNLKYIKI